MSQISNHRQSVDLARFLACFGIVAAHAYAVQDDWIGHLSLGLFLVLTGFLAMQSYQRSDGSYNLRGRVVRLMLPWLFWSAFFRLVDLKVSDSVEKWQILRDPWTLVVGSSIHLWFLPFIMLAMLLVKPVGAAVTTPTRLAVALVGLALVSAPMFWAMQVYAAPAPLTQWLFGLPVYVLGLLVGVAHRIGRTTWPMVSGAAMTVVAYLVTEAAPWVWTICAAVLVFEAFWRMPLQHPWLPNLGRSAFGIYLVHPFFMLVVYKFVGAKVDHLLATLLTFGMSWAAVVALRRVPFFKRVT
ncbi:MAG: acyltransferase [Cypionkella sp.]|uniref:acyltransferase n=1 Tax=Cypionkella sp. TaxID=2811411 RepID=UPI0026240620|nr:acyltransferase [Cypionkella sp.]MDB5658711.1 acyltransferase [Cypionkella sp.]